MQLQFANFFQFNDPFPLVLIDHLFRFFPIDDILEEGVDARVEWFVGIIQHIYEWPVFGYFYAINGDGGDGQYFILRIMEEE